MSDQSQGFFSKVPYRTYATLVLLFVVVAGIMTGFIYLDFTGAFTSAAGPTITASPNPCKVSFTASTCGVNVYWSWPGNPKAWIHVSYDYNSHDAAAQTYGEYFYGSSGHAYIKVSPDRIKQVRMYTTPNNGKVYAGPVNLRAMR